MNSVKVTILGKQYPLKVNDGDEELMHRIAAFVDKRFREYKNGFSTQSESTIMTLAALSIAEELFLEKDKQTPLGNNGQELMESVNTTISNLLADIKLKNNDLDKGNY